MPSYFPPRRSTPVSEAQDQEALATQVMQQQADQQDFITKQRREQERQRQQADDAAKEAARAQKAEIARHKKAGVMTETDAAGNEAIKRHEDGAPMFEAGFQGEPTVKDGKGTAKYRDARGNHYDVPLKSIRSEQEGGQTYYAFDSKDDSGQIQTHRQPAGTKPLFNIDKTTGQRIADVTDAATGSVTPAIVGTDPAAASQAAITKRKDALQLRQNEIGGQAEELRLQQNAKEVEFAPIKEKHDAAKAELDKITKAKVQYAKNDEEGLVAVTTLGDGTEYRTPVDTKDPKEVSKANAWLEQRNRVQADYEAAKAAHDPAKEELHSMDKQRADLALKLYHEKKRANAEIQRMEEAAKAGQPVYLPEWQKRALSLVTQPRTQDVSTVADLEDAQHPLAEDVKQVALPSAGAINAALEAGMVSPRSPLALTRDTDTRGMQEAATSASLTDTLTAGLAQNRPVTVADKKAAHELAVKSLGMSPDGVDVSEQKPEGHYELSRKGELFAYLDPQQKRLMLLDTPTTLGGKGAEIIANASQDGVPVYMHSAEQPYTAREVHDLIASGVDASMSAGGNEEQASANLAKVGLSPDGIREKVMAGKLSVQDGKMLNEKLNGAKQVNTTEAAFKNGFGKFLVETPLMAEKYRNGSHEQKAEVVNFYADRFAAQAAAGVVLDRSVLARRREELLAGADDRGAVSKGLAYTGGAIKNGVASLAGIGYWLLRAPDRAIRLVGGTDDEATNLIWNQSRDLAQRLTGEAAPWNKDATPMSRTLGDVQAWADRADFVDELPDALAEQLADEAFTQYHGFSPESAADVDTTRDTFNVKKNPQLRPLLEQYLKTGNAATFQSMFTMLKANARERDTQIAVQKYVERPRTATPAAAVARANLLGIKLDDTKASAALNLAGQLENAKEPKQYQALLKQAAGVLGLEKPEHAALALAEIARQETTDPDSFTGSFRGASVAGIEEMGTEVASDLALAALSSTVIGAPEAVALKGAQIAAKQGIRASMKGAFTRLVTHNLDNLANRSSTFATIRETIGRGRAALGRDLRALGEDFAAAGIQKPKFGAPLTTGQKVANFAVGTGKATLAGAPIEAFEEGLTALLSNDPSAANIGDSMLQGALGVGGITPAFAGVQGIRNAYAARGQLAQWEKIQSDYIASINEVMGKEPGFKPLTTADFDAWQGLQESPQHREAAAEYAAARNDYNTLFEEGALIAAGNAAVAITPELIAAKARLEAATANLAGISQIAFTAMDELRGIPENERVIYTAAAKAAAGATDYTEAEAKALMQQSGANAVTFQQATPLPAGVQGPVPVNTLADAPNVTQAAPGVIRLPDGVRLDVPQPLMDMLAAKAPSMVQLTRGTAPATNQAPAGWQGMNKPGGQPSATPTNATPPGAKTKPAPANPTPAPAPATVAPELSKPWEQFGAVEVLPDGQIRVTTNTAEKNAAVEAELKHQGINWNARGQTSGNNGDVFTLTFRPKAKQKAPKTQPAPAKQLPAKAIESIARTAIGRVTGKSAKLKALIKESKTGLKRPTGGFWMRDDGTIAFHLPTLIADLSGLGLDNAAIGKRVEYLLDEEIRHAANMEAARRLFEAERQAGRTLRGMAFESWRDAWYGDIWNNHFTEEMRAKVKEAYGDTLPTADWMRAMEGLRMLDQLRATGSITEAVLRALDAVIAALRDFLDLVTAGGKKVIEDEINAMQGVLAEYGYERGTVKPDAKKKPAKAKASTPALQTPDKQIAAQNDNPAPKTSTSRPDLTNPAVKEGDWIMDANGATGPVVGFDNGVPLIGMEGENEGDVVPQKAEGGWKMSPVSDLPPVEKAPPGSPELAKPTIAEGKHWLFDTQAGDVAAMSEGRNVFIVAHFTKLKDAKDALAQINQGKDGPARIEAWLAKPKKEGGKAVSKWAVFIPNVTQDFVDEFNAIKAKDQAANTPKQAPLPAPEIATLRNALRQLRRWKQDEGFGSGYEQAIDNYERGTWTLQDSRSPAETLAAIEAAVTSAREFWIATNTDYIEAQNTALARALAGNAAVADVLNNPRNDAQNLRIYFADQIKKALANDLRAKLAADPRFGLFYDFTQGRIADEAWLDMMVNRVKEQLGAVQEPVTPPAKFSAEAQSGRFSDTAKEEARQQFKDLLSSAPATVDKSSDEGQSSTHELGIDSPAQLASYDELPDQSLDREELTALTTLRERFGSGVIAAHPRQPLLTPAQTPREKESRRGALSGFQKLSAELQAVFGKRVLFVKRRGKPLPDNAYNVGTSRNVLAVDIDAVEPVSYLVGHELGHAIEAQSPALYRALSAALLEMAGDTTAYRARLTALGYKESELDAEIINDFIGSQFMEPAFWRDLAGRDKNLFERMAEAAVRFIQSILRKAAVLSRDVRPLFAGIDKARALLVEVLTTYATDAKFPQMGSLAGELSKSTGKAKQLPIPPEKLPGFIKLAQTLIGEGVRTPQDLAAFLEETFPGGKARLFSQALWNAVSMVDPALTGQHDWQAVYAELDRPITQPLPNESLNPNIALARKVISSVAEWVNMGTNNGTRQMDSRWEAGAVKRFLADNGAAKAIMSFSSGPEVTAKIAFNKAKSFADLIHAAKKLIDALTPGQPAEVSSRPPSVEGASGAVSTSEAAPASAKEQQASTPSETEAGTFPVELAKRLMALPHESRTFPMGDRNADLRRDVLEVITGERPPKSKAGANAVREALRKFFGISEDDTTSGIESEIQKALQQVIDAATAKREESQAETEPLLPRLGNGWKLNGTTISKDGFGHWTEQERDAVRNIFKQAGILTNSTTADGNASRKSSFVVPTEVAERIAAEVLAAEREASEASKRQKQSDDDAKTAAELAAVDPVAMKWMNSLFGRDDFANSYNKLRLSEFVTGKVGKFTGMVNPRWLEGAQAAGAVLEGGKVDFAALKAHFAAYEVASREPSTPAAEAPAKREVPERGDSMAENGPSAATQQPTAEETAPEVETSPEPEKPPVVPPAKRTKKTIAKIEDFGEKIGGARKDNWKERGLGVADFDSLSDTEKQAYTVKAQVYPKPDYQAWIDGGMPRELAWALKEVYDAISPKPNLTRAQQADPAQREAALRLYVEFVSKIRDALPNISNLDELKALKGELLPVDSRGTLQPEARAALEVSSKTARYRYILGGAFVPTSYTLYQYKEELEKNTAWPASQEAWQRMFDIRKVPIGSTISTRLPDGTYERKTITAESPDNWQVIKRDGRWNVIVSDGHATREEAEAVAKTLAEAKRGEKGGPLKRPLNPDAKRVGPDYRQGRDVTGQDLLDTFGFRGGEFGNWTNEADRQQSLNQAYDGMMDLARVLNVPPKSLSLNGELGIAFGARGSGKAAAHYEPAKVVINLTRTSGAGALAHEWAHAVDDYFGRMVTKGQIGKYVSHGVKGTADFRQELADAINAVMKAISERQTTSAEYIESLQTRNAEAKKALESWLKSVDRETAEIKLSPASQETVAELRDMLLGNKLPPSVDENRPNMIQIATDMLTHYNVAAKEQKKRIAWPVSGSGKMSDLAFGLGRNAGAIHFTNSELAKVEAGALEVPQHKVETSMLKDSRKQGEYWQRRHELFARTFEAFVEDSIRLEGNRSPYLVQSTFDSGSWGNLYPQGDERTATNEALRKMVATLKTRETDKGVALFSAPASPSTPTQHDIHESREPDGPHDARGDNGSIYPQRVSDEAQSISRRDVREKASRLQVRSERTDSDNRLGGGAQSDVRLSTMPRDRAERIVANLTPKEQAGKLNPKEREALSEARSNKNPAPVAQSGDVSQAELANQPMSLLQRGRSPNQIEESGKSSLAEDVVAATRKDEATKAAWQAEIEELKSKISALGLPSRQEIEALVKPPVLLPRDNPQFIEIEAPIRPMNRLSAFKSVVSNRPDPEWTVVGYRDEGPHWSDKREELYQVGRAGQQSRIWGSDVWQKITEAWDKNDNPRKSVELTGDFRLAIPDAMHDIRLDSRALDVFAGRQPLNRSLDLDEAEKVNKELGGKVLSYTAFGHGYPQRVALNGRPGQYDDRVVFVTDEWKNANAAKELYAEADALKAKIAALDEARKRVDEIIEFERTTRLRNLLISRDRSIVERGSDEAVYEVKKAIDRYRNAGGKGNLSPLLEAFQREVDDIVRRRDEHFAGVEAGEYLTAEERAQQQRIDEINRRWMPKWFPPTAPAQPAANAAWWTDLLTQREEEASAPARTFVAKVWRALAAHNEAFQYGRAPSASASQIAQAVSLPGKLVTATSQGYTVRFHGPNGYLDIHDADSDRPYIRSTEADSKGKEGGGGSQIYQAALDWIHNNGKRIKDDPGGLSSINAIRRTSNMASSALRWGTTKHLKPHASQKVPWGKNAAINTAALLTKEMDNAFTAVAEAKDWRYDFTRDEFIDSTGQPLDEQRIRRAGLDANPATSGIGLATLQRAIVTASTLEAFQRKESESLLSQIGSREDLSDGISGILYSAPSRPVSHSAALSQAAATLRGEGPRIAPGLNSLFNPQAKRPATGERKLFDMPKAATVDVTNILRAYRAVQSGTSSAFVPIRAVFERMKAAHPEITPETFMAEIRAADERGDIMVEAPERPETIQQAGPFVVRNALGVPSTNMAALEQGTLASAPAKREKTNVEDAIARIENFYLDPNDTDNWPEDVKAAYEASPLGRAIEEGDFLAAWNAASDDDKSVVVDDDIENLRAAYAAQAKYSAAFEKVWSQPLNAVLTPAEMAEAQASADPELALIRLRNEKVNAITNTFDEATQEAYAYDIDAAEEWVASDELAEASKAPYLEQVRARIADTIRQIEATGRHKWDAKTETFDAIADDEVPVLYSAPSKQDKVREILESMPPIWRDVLQDQWNGKTIEDIAAARHLSLNAVGNILRMAGGRFQILMDRAATKPTVQVEDGKVKATHGRPDLAMSGNAAVAAIDQRRMRPEEVTHAEMQELANRMFAANAEAAEKLIVRWMDSGTTVLSTDGMPDAIKAIVDDAQARSAAEMLMTAAAKMLVTKKAMAGGNTTQLARLIDLYRNTGTEQARALGMRQDPFDTPEERAAMYLQETLLTPPESLRNEIRRNPANKERILAAWAAKADKIKAELLAEGIDIDATLRELAKEKQLADETIPEPVKPVLARAPKKTRQLVKALLQGLRPSEVIKAAGLTAKAAFAAYQAFRESINQAGTDAAKAMQDQLLRSAPAGDFAANLGLPDLTEEQWMEAVKADKPLRTTPETEKLKDQRERKKAGGEIDMRNRKSVRKAIRKIGERKANLFDKMSEFWRASILSGPQTHVVNIVSSSTFGLYESTFKKLATGAQADIARMFGMKPDAASLADLPAMLAAAFQAVKDASLDCISEWQQESNVFDSYALALEDAGGNSFKEQYTPALKGKLGAFMRGISFRLMGAADAFVKSFFTRIEVVAQARQIARNENLTGEAFRQRIAELTNTVGSEAWERALGFAKRITFQNEEVFGPDGSIKLESPMMAGSRTVDTIDGLANLISRTKKGDFGKMLKGLSHFTFPFVDTPTNIFKMGITMSPIGGLLAIIDATHSLMRRKKGNVEEAERIYNAARAFDDLANQIVAWGFILGLSQLVKPGDDDEELPYITGTIPWRSTSPGEREIAYRTAPPQSIRIGGQWLSYKRLDPFASALAFTVDAIKEMQSGKPLDEAWGNIGVGMMRNMQDKTFLQGVSDLVNAVQDPERFGTKWATNIAIGFVPNLIRQPIRTGDDVFRENDLPNDMGFWEALGRRVGFGVYPKGWSGGALPDNPVAPMPAFDIWGREASKNTGTGQPGTDWLLRLLSPVDTRDAEHVDPLDRALLRYNMRHDEPFGVAAPTREIQRTIAGKVYKVSLTDAEYTDFARKSGQASRAAIGDQYTGRDLTEADVKNIKKLIEDVHDRFRGIAFMRAVQARGGLNMLANTRK